MQTSVSVISKFDFYALCSMISSSLVRIVGRHFEMQLGQFASPSLLADIISISLITFSFVKVFLNNFSVCFSF